MAGEMVTSRQSARTSTPFGSISILVVDDDTTCLSIVAAILKSWKYEVVTVKHPIEALCILRIKGGSFDLVVTDVHMPDMNGFELQKQIHEEFKLPVVFMSADDNDGIILKGLQSGAAFFIVKPIAPDDLKNLWQYAISKKKGKAIIEEIGSIQETSQADKACNEDTEVQETSQADKGFNEEVESASSVNEERLSAKDSKRKAEATDSNAGNGENKADYANPKKAKVVWTNALHNQFLEAIRSIGLERSVPKKILELMNVPGLTRENVASHLQKYRIFLKRVSEASCKIQSAAERSMVERTFGSSFASEQPSLMYNRSGLRYMKNLEQEQTRTPFQQRYGGHFPVVEAPKLGHSSSSDHEASFTNSTARFGSGKSCLLCNQGNLKQPMIDIAKPLYQANPSGFRMELPKSFTNGLSKYNSTAGYGKMGAFSNSNSNLNPNYYSTNYAGYRMAGDGRLIGLASTDFNYNNGLMNGVQNGNMSNVPLAQNASHISPTVINNSIHQESNSLPQLPTPPQQNYFSNGGERDYIFGLLNNFSNSDSNSFMQPYDEGDLSFTFLNQINLQSPTRQDGEEALCSDISFSSYDLEDNPPVNKQSLEQQPGGELLVSKFGISGNQSDEYFPLFEQNPSQQDDEEFLESLFGHAEYGGPGGDDNPRGL